MKRIIRLLMLAVCVMGTVQAAAAPKEKKQRTFRLWGHVKDKFTKVGIPDVKITLMTADSTVVDTMTVSHGGAQWAKDSWFWFDRPAVASHYIIKAEHPDYEVCCVDFSVKHVGRNTYFDAPWHLMKRKGLHGSMDRTLDDLVVKGSRVKLAYKGDTLVFDAAAFKLPDGSMLDALIRQMPGVTLSADGEITVNGRKVDYLMLNGKDFFKGNNKAMLENLPHYAVKDIRVYDRMTDKSRYVGRNIEDKEYVMDVNLKKEYNIGYMGNAEAGAATEEKWLGRAFGSRFTDHSNISAYVNLNNINEQRTPNTNGEWNPSNAPVGHSTTRSAGLSVRVDDKDGRYEENLNIGGADNDYSNSGDTQTTRFMPQGNTHSLTDNRNGGYNRFFQLTNNFRLKIPVWMELYTNISMGKRWDEAYGRSASLTRLDGRYGGTSEALDSIFSPYRDDVLKEAVVNRSSTAYISDDSEVYLYQKALLNKRLPWGDNIEFEANVTYNKKSSDGFGDSRIEYNDGLTPADNRNTYTDKPMKKYNYEMRGEYYLNFLNNWTWRIYTLYNQTNENTSNRYYRMERLEGWLPGDHPLGTYPSDPALLAQALSAADSWHQNQMTRNSQSGLHFYYDKRTDSTSVFLRFHLPVFVRNEKQDYRRGVVDTVARRTKAFVNGNINFNMSWNKWRSWMGANFWHNTILPSTYDMLDIVDDTNPLSVNRGNPGLKTEHSYRVNFSVSHRTKDKRLMMRANADADYHTNPLLRGYSYDSRTGAYTWQPQNGRRRWYTQANVGTTVMLGKEQEWQLSADCFVKYNRSEVFRLSGGDGAARLYDAGKTMVWPSMSVKYSKNTLTVSAGGKVLYDRTHYDDPSTEGYKSWNYQAFGNLQYTVPVINLQLSSTLQWDRQGSSVAGVPAQEFLIWNVFVSRSFLKDKSLIVKLNAFDLLDNVSHNYFWGDGDTYTTSSVERLSRYVMLSVAYQIKMKPKK